MQEARLDILVVHRDDAILGGAVDREEVDPVVVLADLLLLLGAGVGAGAVGGHVARDRLAGRAEDLEAVAFGDDDGVVVADRHGLEADQGRCGLRQRRLAGSEPPTRPVAMVARPPIRKPRRATRASITS
jgi:hypothetical protein